MHVVYGLEDQRNNEIFYVGITDDVQARFMEHMRRDGSNPLKDARIQEMKMAGYLPLMRTLQIVANEEVARKREGYWMKHFYDLGAPLTNQIIPMKQDSVIVVYQDKLRGRVKSKSRQKKVLMSDQKRIETIKQLRADGKPHREISRIVGLYGPKYAVYKQVCAEEGIEIK